MTLSQHIWNYFVSSGRLEEARGETQLPSAGLKDHLSVIRKEYSITYPEILNELSELLVVNSPAKPNSDLYVKISNLVASEPFNDSLILNKIKSKEVNKLIKCFATNNYIIASKRGEDTVCNIPARRYDIEIVFEKFGKYKGLGYATRVFPKDAKRMYSECLFYFVSESLMGFGIGRWDLIFDGNQLTAALENLWKNCECLRKALDSYELGEVDPTSQP